MVVTTSSSADVVQLGNVRISPMPTGSSIPCAQFWPNVQPACNHGLWAD
jgi:hypothetical protein